VRGSTGARQLSESVSILIGVDYRADGQEGEEECNLYSLACPGAVPRHTPGVRG
jgi:hypothetical protein